jgi:hypothetical protein
VKSSSIGCETAIELQAVDPVFLLHTCVKAFSGINVSGLLIGNFCDYGLFVDVEISPVMYSKFYLPLLLQS